MESRLLAQNKPRPFRAHSPGRHEPHPVQNRLRGSMIGGGLGLDGGDAGLFEGDQRFRRRLFKGLKKSDYLRFISKRGNR